MSAINLPPSPPPTTKRGTTVRSAAGALAWIAPPPLFLTAQLVAGSGWRVPYSWSANNISDLGNITCGSWGDDRRDVCSPLHLVMNVGFVATGLLIVAGVILLWGSAHLGNKLSSLLILFAGAGYVVVGLAPADRQENIHVVLGAIPIFFAGNAGLLLTAMGRRIRPRALRLAALLLGLVGLGATILFLLRHYLGLGMGGMERVAAWPLLVFLALTGLGILRQEGRARAATSETEPDAP